MPEPAFPQWQRRLLILAAPVVIVVFALVLLLSVLHRRESTARVLRTYADLELLREARARLVDAETGQRGYIITGDSAYLQPYHSASQDAHAALDTLAGRLRADPVLSAGLARLTALVNRRLEILELPVLGRAQGFGAAREALVAGRGREAMDQVRAELAGLETVGHERLAAELRAQERAEVVVLGLLLAGGLLVLAVAVFTRRRFASYERGLEQANAGLTELNARLQEQALELELQSQELQLQAAHLEKTGAELLASNDELWRQQQQLQDMTIELETANEDLQAANSLAEQRRAEAEAANRVKTQFLTSMSHELRTPLNAIAGYVDLLDLSIHGPLTDKQRHSLHRIRLNGKHLLVLINDILDYAKIQAGRVDLRNRAVPLAELVDDTAQLVESLLRARSIAMRIDPMPDLRVLGDPDRIRQILLNLFTNAAKYSHAGSTVLVTTTAEPDLVHLSVHDQGEGIPPEMHDEIFNPFVRLNREAGGSLGDGVGLGLSISRELATAMHGTLAVTSTPGEGATFTLTLGRASAAALESLSA